MRCNDCGRTIVRCVKLSESAIICEECYVESLAAWHEQNAGMLYQSQSYCPPPKEIHELAANMKRESLAKMADNRARNGKSHYEPKTTTANMLRRKGTEDRAR